MTIPDKTDKYDIYIPDNNGQLYCLATYCPADMVDSLINDFPGAVVKKHGEET